MGKKGRIRTSEACVMLDPVMDIDIGQVEDTRFVVSAEDTSNHVRNIPTESRGKVVVFTNKLIHLFERNVASVSGEDACKMSSGG